MITRDQLKSRLAAEKRRLAKPYAGVIAKQWQYLCGQCTLTPSDTAQLMDLATHRDALERRYIGLANLLDD